MQKINMDDTIIRWRTRSSVGVGCPTFIPRGEYMRRSLLFTVWTRVTKQSWKTRDVMMEEKRCKWSSDFFSFLQVFSDFFGRCDDVKKRQKGLWPLLYPTRLFRAFSGSCCCCLHLSIHRPFASYVSSILRRKVPRTLKYSIEMTGERRRKVCVNDTCSCLVKHNIHHSFPMTGQKTYGSTATTGSTF